MSDSKHQMTVDFPGLLSLLGDRLYSDKRVFVREMIQNGSDSIVRRYGAGRAGQGRIDVEVVPSERRITFRDNGLGMDAEDIGSDLSRIAASGTRTARLQAGAEDLIGKHGIGFLSAFVVAERVRVRTRKEGASTGWLWENENKLDYTLTEIQEGSAEIGTTVDVFVSREHAGQFVSDSAVRDILQRYCDMLRTPIFLNGSRNPVNSQIMPWERDTVDYKGREWETRSYLEKTFPDSVLETIHFDFREGVRASGVLYISTSRAFQFDPPRYVRLYQSRMLLSQNAAELLPKWATFINGMIDSPDIEPNAARDDFVRNGAADELTEKFSGRIVEYLTELHRNNPERFKEIVQYHNLGLMAACWYHDDLFDHFYDLLLWRVNAKPFAATPSVDIFGEEEKGAWRTLVEILDRLAPGAQAEVSVPTISDGIAVAQYFEMADAADAVIVDTSPYFAEDLLRKIEGLQNPARIGGRRIRIVSVTEDGADRLFQPLRGAEDDAVRSLAAYFDGKIDLAGTMLRVEAVHTKPESVVGVVRSSADVAADLADARRTAANANLPEYVRNMAKQFIRTKRRESVRLVLNAQNPLVRKLADALLQARSLAGQAMPERDELFRELAPALYNIAILNSRAVLSQSGQSRVGQQFAAIVERLIDTLEDVRRLKKDIAAQEAALSRVAPSKKSKTRDYVSVFYMTPFSEPFAPVRAAVTNVIGRWGAKLTLATDTVHKELLIENLHHHIEDADAFVADITGLNANVMLELGAVKFENLRQRPIVLLYSAMKSEELPADLKGQLYIDYKALRGIELEQFLADEFGRNEGFMKVLGNPARAKYLNANVLRSYIEQTALNPERFDIPGLLKAFPTDRHWLSATEADVAKHLPEGVRKRAAEIIEAVHAGTRG